MCGHINSCLLTCCSVRWLHKNNKFARIWVHTVIAISGLDLCCDFIVSIQTCNKIFRCICHLHWDVCWSCCNFVTPNMPQIELSVAGSGWDFLKKSIELSFGSPKGNGTFKKMAQTCDKMITYWFLIMLLFTQLLANEKYDPHVTQPHQLDKHFQGWKNQLLHY